MIVKMRFSLIERKGLYGIGLNNAEDWLEVIGNIYDNKELLEGI